MNYRHIYHAGNFADVIKHILLTALIASLSRKEKPFCYIDTHAGCGYYDLFSQQAEKTKESTGGIGKIIHQKNPPPLVVDYLNCVHEINDQLAHSNAASLRYYPGSPLIARHLIRPHDRILACELELQAYQALRATFANDKQVSTHHMDGFVSLKSLLPPKERRGLVLIDPPYEDPDEFTRIAKMLPAACKKWPTGVYVLWYPVKDPYSCERLHRLLKQHLSQPILIVELTICAATAHHLNGSGLVIINPPWQFLEQIKKTVSWVWKALTINGQGRHCAYLLK